MKHINEIATELGLDSANLVPYGKYKAKIPLTEIKRNGRKGKLIVITGISPTPAG